eukprot:14283036-Ditylum_brightwellii.AAC.1
MAIPEGMYGQIALRSGLALKHNINVGASVIDPDFSREIQVLLINASQKKFQTKRGNCIAQVIFEEYAILAMQFFSKFPDTSRGVRGFGSTNNSTAKIAHVISSDEPSNPPTQPIESKEQTSQKDKEPTTSQGTTTPH